MRGEEDGGDLRAEPPAAGSYWRSGGEAINRRKLWVWGRILQCWAIFE